MRIITELELREIYKNEPFKSYNLRSSEKLTPSAAQFLSENKVKIIIKNCDEPDEEKQKQPVYTPFKEGYIILETGEKINVKPEEYTHLKGNQLVLKNHKRIKFRGKIDSSEAEFIDAIVKVKNEGKTDLANDLATIFEHLKTIMRAEVTETSFDFINFNSMTENQIREYSHYPSKYIGVNHFIPDPSMGGTIALLNKLRTIIRELEISAVEAFYDEKTKSVHRPDIIKSLNRLSSLMYIIMCRQKAGRY